MTSCSLQSSLGHPGHGQPSSALMAPMTQRFVDAIKRFAERDGIDIVSFRRGER